MTQAIIVAAGKGSRLYPLTDSVPKIMIPVGKAEKPMAQLVIEHCKRYGINNFLFCLNKENGKQVINYFGNGSRFDATINYSFSDEPQGTSGEIKIAYDRGLVEFPVIIYYGDILCTTNLFQLMNTVHDIVVVVNDEIRLPYGFIEDSNNIAKNIIEKPLLKDILPERSVGAIMAIYYINNRDFFEFYCEKNKDISGDILPKMMKDGYVIAVYHDRNSFIDIGTWSNYKEAMRWDI